MRGKFVVGAALVLAASAGAAFAQQTTVIKPMIMVQVDTSGSMLNGTLANSCTGANSNKFELAKCTLNRVFNGTGDAIFGMSRYNPLCSDTGTVAAGCDYDADGSCPTTNENPAAGDIIVQIAEDNTSELLMWLNGMPNSNANSCNAGCTAERELRAPTNQGTPTGGAITRIRQYYANQLATQPSPITADRNAMPPIDSCRSYRVIVLTDGAPNCPSSDNSVAAACKLRATCYNGTQATAAACDTTTGAFTNTPDCTGAGSQMYDVRTDIIGYGITAPNTNIEQVAHVGGRPFVGPACTPNPAHGQPGHVHGTPEPLCSVGDVQGFYAADEADLSAAFSRIIQDSLRFEVCNGVDDNCNNMIDEGFAKYCDRDGVLGTVVMTESLCTPVTDDCDGVDDNCEAGTNDEPKNACGTCGATPTEICDNLDNDCDGFIDEGNVCGSCIISAEICDGKDNDCDGRIDELVTRTCGSAIAPCSLGMQACVEQTVPQMMGTWGVCSGTVGTPEMCDGVDNDCDGVIDGNVRTCGTDVGECVAGTEECIAGTFMNCTAVGPQTEVCNNLDDNCNMMTDEGDPGGGGSCTAPAICGNGTLHCVMGTLTCQGSGTAMPEVCNGVDDDCNNMIDDGIADRGACGMPLGGACQAGVDRCVMGSFQCVGYVGPVPETCNCIDDDCAGGVDNPPSGGSLCPVGSECTDCQCASPCGPGEFPCPAGKRCRNGFCVADPCAGVTCPAEADGTRKVCSMGTCVTACSLQSCGAPLVCRPTDALCVPDNCHYFPARCAADQICVGGQCTSDPCATVSCTGNTFCRAGTCVPSCAGVSCAGNQQCKDGVCVATGCAQSCGANQICDMTTMRCVAERCNGVSCQIGQACDPQTGTCTTDPCSGVKCPGSQVCELGNCFDQQQIDPDGGMVTQRPTKILVTGDGGCACEIGQRQSRTQAGAALLLALSMLVYLISRGRRARVLVRKPISRRGR